MTFEQAKQEIMSDQDKRVTRKAWDDNYKWVCYANSAIVPTDNIWNQHTKKQSVSFGNQMKLNRYFIVCENGEINYGLDCLTDIDRKADDWAII